MSEQECTEQLKANELAFELLARFAGVEPHRINGTWEHLADKIREMRTLIEFCNDAPVEHIKISNLWIMSAWDVLDHVIGKMAESDETCLDVSFDVMVGGSLSKLTARFDLTFTPEDEDEY